MSWVNLDDVYVNKSGDSIAGNLSVGGALTINDGKGTDTTYNVANEITTLRDSVSLTLLATTNGTAKANININGVNLIIVFAKNNYVGITTAIVPVAALSSNEDTVHLAGGYRASGLFSNYDCRMTLTTFAGRDAYTNGTNRVNETQWFVYGVL